MKSTIQPLIFIISNDQIFRMMIKKELENRYFRKIHFFETVNDCHKNLDKHPDIIVFDSHTDIHESRTQIRLIKERSFHTDVILLSSKINLLSVMSVHKNGASDLIIKNDQLIKKVLKSIKHFARSRFQRQSKLADSIVIGWSVTVAVMLFLYFILQ